jgi:hypothetical protein
MSRRTWRLVEVALTGGRGGVALGALVVVLHGADAMARGERPAFPPSLTTEQDRIDWLAAEVDEAARAVEVEAEKPLPQQREALYRDVLARGADLLRLVDTIAGRASRLRVRVDTTLTEARAGLERIANGQLRIGMSTEQVREIRGEPSRIAITTTAGGVRQHWHYGMTRLSFDGGHLVEIVLMLTPER